MYDRNICFILESFLLSHKRIYFLIKKSLQLLAGFSKWVKKDLLKAWYILLIFTNSRREKKIKNFDDFRSKSIIN